MQYNKRIWQDIGAIVKFLSCECRKQLTHSLTGNESSVISSGRGNRHEIGSLTELTGRLAEWLFVKQI